MIFEENKRENNVSAGRPGIDADIPKSVMVFLKIYHLNR